MDSLTPEEQAELQALEQEQQGSDELSAEEQAELASLDAEFGPGPELAPISQSQAAMASEAAATSTESSTVFDSVIDTVSDAAVAFGNQIPGAKSLSAGVGAVIDTVTEGTSLSDAYNQNKKFIDTYDKGVDERSPIVSKVASGTSELVQLGLTGGAIKGIGAVAKLATVAPKATAAATAIGSDFTVGLTQRLSESEIMSMESLQQSVEGAALWSLGTAGVGVLGSKALKGAGTLLNPAISSVTNSATAKIAKEQLLNNSVRAVKTFKNFLDDAAIDGARFSKTLQKAKISSGEALKDGHIAVKAIGRELDNAGQSIKASYHKLTKAGVKEADSIDLSDTILDIEDLIDHELRKTGKDNASNIVVKKTKEIRNLVQDTVVDPETGLETVIPKQLNLAQVWEVKKQIFKKIPKSGENKEVMEQIAMKFHSKIDDIVVGLKQSDNEAVRSVAKELGEQNMDYRILSTAKDIADITNLSARENASSLGILAKSVLPDLGAATSTVQAGANLLGKAIQTGPEMAVSALRTASRKFSPVLNGAVESDKVIAENLGKMGVLADFIETNVGSSAATAAMSSRLGTLISDEEASAESIDKAIRTGLSVKSLVSQPMDRNSASFEARSEDVLRIVQAVNPAMANTLVEMIRNGEDVAPVMEQIANRPEAREFFKPGQGWEGKTYDPQLKAQLTKQLQAATDIPTSARMKAAEALAKDGTIPVMEELPQREPLKYDPRDKKKERF